jgi:hypothetical protein
MNNARAKKVVDIPLSRPNRLSKSAEPMPPTKTIKINMMTEITQKDWRLTLPFGEKSNSENEGV